MEPMTWAIMLEVSYDVNKYFKLVGKLETLLKEKNKFLVLGATGVGKTQFVTSLYNDGTKSIRGTQRTKFNVTNNMKIKNSLFTFIDTPGHVSYQNARREALQKLVREKYSGIINIVSFGYHESLSEAPTATNNGQPIPEYLKNRRIDEIDLLNEWIHIIDNRNVDSIITLVNKADLWWDNREQVEEYYGKGPYFKALENLTKITNYSIIPYCAIMQPFFMQYKGGIFGDNEKDKLKCNFISELLNACGEPLV